MSLPRMTHTPDIAGSFHLGALCTIVLIWGYHILLGKMRPK
ncbi:hypothetical protein DDI_1449 [Dickeya dianthicola RNS04.9]|nr:hypothetical protein DDI_1449 [Dickeya dianthicola RNS04.9]